MRTKRVDETLSPSVRSAEQNNRSHLTGLSIVVYDDPFRARRPLIDCFGGIEWNGVMFACKKAFGNLC